MAEFRKDDDDDISKSSISSSPTESSSSTTFHSTSSEEEDNVLGNNNEDDDNDYSVFSSTSVSDTGEIKHATKLEIASKSQDQEPWSKFGGKNLAVMMVSMDTANDSNNVTIKSAPTSHKKQVDKKQHEEQGPISMDISNRKKNDNNNDPRNIEISKTKANKGKISPDYNSPSQQSNTQEEEVVARILPNDSDESNDDNNTTEEKDDCENEDSDHDDSTSQAMRGKMRIKLSMSKLSPSPKELEDRKKRNEKKRKSEVVAPVEATIVLSSSNNLKSKNKSKEGCSNNNGNIQNENILQNDLNNFYWLRPIKMPPLASPGLMIPNANSSGMNSSSSSNNNNSTLSSNNSSTTNGNNNKSSSHSINVPNVSNNSTSKSNNNNAHQTNMSTPSFLFQTVMEAAGYNIEQRTRNPHRGSSITHEVGDMFDRDVTMTVNFPPLVPHWMMSSESVISESSSKKEESNLNSTFDTKRNDNKNKNDKDNMQQQQDCENQNKVIDGKKLADILKEMIDDMFPLSSYGKENSSKDDINPTLQFLDMIPKSLTTNYPSSYVAKRMRYEELVFERERAIVASQKAYVKAETAREKEKQKWDKSKSGGHASVNDLDNNAKADLPNDEKCGKSEKHSLRSELQTPEDMKLIEIPPIPRPPTPPNVISNASSPSYNTCGENKDATSKTVLKLDEKDNEFGKHKRNHPISSEKQHLIAHLDPALFYPTCRYYGLISNSIADPQYVGPNAPGLTGSGSAGGSNSAFTNNNGLATAQLSSHNSGGGGGSSSVFSSFQHNYSANSSNINSGSLGAGSGAASTKEKGSSMTDSTSGRNNDRTGGNNSNGLRIGNSGNSKKSSSLSKTSSSSSDKKTINNIVITGSNSDLKKAFEVGGEFAENMRKSLILAAIHACETSSEGPWIAFNGETYPDVRPDL